MWTQIERKEVKPFRVLDSLEIILLCGMIPVTLAIKRGTIRRARRK